MPAFSPAISARLEPEELLVVDAERGDPADQRPLDDIGRVEPAAEPDFDHGSVGGRSRKGEEGDGGRDFEEAGLDAVAGVENFARASAASASSSISRPAMRMRSLKRTRCGLVKMCTVSAGRLERGAKEGAGRAFAVGAGDMEDGRKRVLRAAEPVEQAGDAVEPEPVAAGRKQATAGRAAPGRPGRPTARSRPSGRRFLLRRQIADQLAQASRCSSWRGTTMSTMPWSSRYSARWKPSGSFSRMVCSITRWPAKPMSAPGSASWTSPSIA